MADRKLVDGTWAQELDQPVDLVIKNKMSKQMENC